MCVIYDSSNSMKAVNVKNMFLAVGFIKPFKVQVYAIYHRIYCDSLGFRLGLKDHTKILFHSFALCF